MDSTIFAAIIGAIAAIIVAVIAAKAKEKKPEKKHDNYFRVEDNETEKDKKSEQGHDDYSVKVDNVTGHVIGGSRNIVTIITEGVSKHEFDRAQSNDYVERGRERIRAYAERITRNGEWDWNPLGHAIEYYVDAISYDPQNQHAWINLAYLYHIIGDRNSAL